MPFTPYVLSATIPTSQREPRSAAMFDDDHVVIGAIDGTIQEFTRNTTDSNFTPSTMATQVHEHSVFGMLPVPHDHPRYPAYSLVTGGGDNMITVSLVDGTIIHKMSGHTAAVEGLAFAHDAEKTLISGGWDGSVCVWRSDAPAVHQTRDEFSTQVLVLPNGLIATASGNKKIAIYKLIDNGGSMALELVRELPNAHKHTIRKLVSSSRGIISCANDGYIKLWSHDLELLDCIEAYAPTPTISEFMYDVIELENGVIVASGDDNTVRFFDFNRNVASLIPGEHHAPQELACLDFPYVVRTLYAFKNQDVLCVSRAGVFVLTPKDSTRVANAELTSVFSALVNDQKSKDMDIMDIDGLPNVDVLLQPGHKHGAHQVVNIDGKAMVCVWSDEGYEWEIVGQAMGKKKEDKKPRVMHNGIEYDQVIDVDIAEGMPHLKLPFNRDDDPYDVAVKFLASHGMGMDGVSQIVEFISPYVDKDAVQKKKKQRQAEKQAEVSEYTHSNWSYFIHSASKPQLMKKALLARHEKVAAMAPDSTFTTLMNTVVTVSSVVLTSDDLTHLDSLLNCVATASFVEPARLTPQAIAVLVKLIQFPAEQVTPVLDVLRVLLCTEQYIQHIINLDRVDNVFSAVNSLLFSALRLGSDDSPLVLNEQANGIVVLALQAFTNYVAKRTLSAEEKSRNNQVMPPERTLIFINSIITQVKMINIGKNPRCVDDISKFFMNICCWMNRIPSLYNNDMYTEVIVYLLTNVFTSADFKNQTLSDSSRLAPIMEELYHCIVYTSFNSVKVKQIISSDIKYLNIIKMLVKMSSNQIANVPPMNMNTIIKLGQDLQIIYQLK